MMPHPSPLGSEPVQLDDAAPIRVDTDGRVMVITLNRPARRNAVDLALAVALRAALDDLDACPDTAVGVLTGAGGSFCAGMDLAAFGEGGEVPILERGGFAGICSAPPAKPLLAAVEGWALAGGLEVALACDLIVAGDGARFGLPETSRGLVAAAGGLVELPRRVPRAMAMQMALTAEPIDAHAALQCGLVSEVTADGDALSRTVEIAHRIAMNSPHAVALSKRIIAESADWPVRGWERAQDELLGEIFTSPDALEGAAAFAQKRPARWSS